MCDPAEFCSGAAAGCPSDITNGSDQVGASVRLSEDRGTMTTTIAWFEAAPGPFSVYRGTRLVGHPWAYNQGCLDDNVAATTTIDTLNPAPGQLFYYLVTRTSPPCTESSLGQRSDDTERPNVSACPSPGLDTDHDGIVDPLDNCPTVANPTQTDVDNDLVGDACDNCPSDANTDQRDLDHDGFGDVCDLDIDGDGILNGADNCPYTYNPDQLDTNHDGIGDACQH